MFGFGFQFGFGGENIRVRLGGAGPLKLLWLSEPEFIVELGSGRGVPFEGMILGTFVREM